MMGQEEIQPDKQGHEIGAPGVLTDAGTWLFHSITDLEAAGLALL